MNKFKIQYVFYFSKDIKTEYTLEFNKDTIELLMPSAVKPSKWTELTFNQCPHCPLEMDINSHCPVAINLLPFIDLCCKLDSYENLDVEVITKDRNYFIKNTTAHSFTAIQRGRNIVSFHQQLSDKAIFFRPKTTMRRV